MDDTKQILATAKKGLKWYTYFFIIALVIIMCVIFFNAFFDSQYSVWLSVNNYHEANLEFVMFLVGIFGCCVLAYDKLKVYGKLITLWIFVGISIGLLIGAAVMFTW